MLGFTVDDFPPPENVELWPENWPAIQLFNRLQTQWRVGFAGPIGLDYVVFFHEMDRLNLDREDYDELLAQIRVIESTALDEMRKKD